MLHILHVFDQAGVAFILAKFQQLQGHESKVLTTKTSDKYGIKDFYRDQMLYAKSEKEFLEDCLMYAKTADIIHIHSRIDALLFLRKKLGNSKRIILHYHGTDIRGLKKIKLPHRSGISDLAIKSIHNYRKIRDRLLLRHRFHEKAQNMSNAVIVATPDLLSHVKGAVFIPNPVDTEHFTPNNSKDGRDLDRVALTMDTEATDYNLTMQYCRKNNVRLNIDVHDRAKQPIMYRDMPTFLQRYAIYVDIRYVNGVLLPNLSKTALEALGCGLRVLNYKLQYHDNLPFEHRPLNVVSQVQSLYGTVYH
jgi:glycosyltransferase involved in cell wall biosynthesis